MLIRPRRAAFLQLVRCLHRWAYWRRLGQYQRDADDGRSGALSERSTSFVGGGQAGYMHQFRELVLGAEVKYSWTGAEFSHASTASPASRPRRASTTDDGDGAARLCLHELARVLEGGWATAGLEYSAAGTATGNASTRGNGWVAGAGLSYAFGPNIIGGVEYDYVHVNSDAAQPVPGVVSFRAPASICKALPSGSISSLGTEG